MNRIEIRVVGSVDPATGSRLVETVDSPRRAGRGSGTAADPR
jgi:hypothetical protein